MDDDTTQAAWDQAEQEEQQQMTHVYQAIAAVTGRLAKTGISKNRKNQQQGYSFRGIDDVYNALSSEIAEARLCLLPRVTSREVTERTTKSGSALFYVVVGVDFDLVSAVDGSRHTVHVIGEAMDSADKATNKAMSAAYKYMAMQVFCIPTEGDNDADATTPEPVVPKIDTKLVNKWSAALFDAQDEQDKLYGIWAEIKGDHDFAGAVWSTLPRAMKDRVKYDNTNRGVLFANKDRQSDNHPNAKGTINIEGVEYWLSAWTKTSKNGERYQSLSVKLKEAAPPRAAAAAPAEFDDEIPF
jgi:hypothetical protein